MATSTETAKSLRSLIVGIGGMSSVTLFAANGPLASDNQLLPTTAPQHDIPGEGECRPDEVPIKSSRVNRGCLKR